MSNSMAFISQFGESVSGSEGSVRCLASCRRFGSLAAFSFLFTDNPGGGKDEVLKYLNEAKTQVIIAKKALDVIMVALGVPTN